MGANDAVHDEVAAKIAAHNAAILADLSRPRSRRRATGSTRRKKDRPRIAGEQRLFGGMATRIESFGQTRQRVSDAETAPRVGLPVVRQREVRCTDCDYRLVVRSDKVICPKCGEIFGDAPMLRALRSGFGGFEFVNDDGAE